MSHLHTNRFTSIILCKVLKVYNSRSDSFIHFIIHNSKFLNPSTYHLNVIIFNEKIKTQLEIESHLLYAYLLNVSVCV